MTKDEKRELIEKFNNSLMELYLIGKEMFERTSCDKYYKNWHAHEAMKDIGDAYNNTLSIIKRDEDF